MNAVTGRVIGITRPMGKGDGWFDGVNVNVK
jgi:hypothetical protein